MSSLTPAQLLAAARVSAYQKMPYFRSMIQSLVPMEVPGLKTFGVTETSILIYDPEILAALPTPAVGTILLHEGLHIYLRHAERFKKLLNNGVLTMDDRDIWNDACDAEINDDLVEAGCQFPEAGMTPGAPILPSTFNLPAHRTAEEYVYTLKDRKNKNPGQGAGSGQGPGQGPGWGPCGSGAGNPLPNEPPASHPDARPPADQSVVRNSTTQQIQNHIANKGRGTVPGDLAAFADAECKPAKIHWSAKLSSMVRAAVAHKLGTGDFTFSQRSRSQEAMHSAFGFEAPILPGEHAPVAEVGIIFDTSGSVSDAALTRCCDEAHAVLRHMAGSKISFIACDSDVHVATRVKSVREIKKNLLGRGGTDFRPAFKALERMKPKPQIAIFATDAEGPAPATSPKGMKVIWLVVDNPGRKPEFDGGGSWGEYIYLDRGELSDG